MRCKIPWDLEVILSGFTKSFFQTEWRKHREKVLFEREKALLPASQQEVRNEQLMQEMQMLQSLATLYKKSTKGEKYLAEAREIAQELGVVLDGNNTSATTAPQISKPRPVIPCIQDNCNGFVMSNNWCCGMCNTKVCKDCLKETGGNEHKCKDEDKETRKLLLNNTKPCPKCGVMISKVDGCNQMWCVMCHTTFSWNSGEIGGVRDHVHNPHYYEWLRRSGREVPRAPGDVPANAPCGQNNVPGAYYFQNSIRQKYSEQEAQLLMRTHQLHVHIQMVELPMIDRLTQGHLNNNDLRKSFLKGDISEEDFKKEIFIRVRSRERNQAIHNVMTLFLTQLTETLQTFYNTRPDYKTRIGELHQLADYCNDCFKKIGSSYNTTPFLISISAHNAYIKRMKPNQNVS